MKLLLDFIHLTYIHTTSLFNPSDIQLRIVSCMHRKENVTWLPKIMQKKKKQLDINLLTDT